MRSDDDGRNYASTIDHYYRTAVYDHDHDGCTYDRCPIVDHHYHHDPHNLIDTPADDDVIDYHCSGLDIEYLHDDDVRRAYNDAAGRRRLR